MDDPGQDGRHPAEERGRDRAGGVDADDGTGGDPADSLDGLVAGTGGLQPWRRAFHAASGVVLALAPEWLGLERGTVLILLTALLGAAVLLDLARLRLPRLNALFFRRLSRLASPREAAGTASSTWYLLAALLVYLFLPGQYVPAVLVLALADPAASVVGRSWGRHPLGKGSLEGGAAFFVVAALVLGWSVGGVAALVSAVLVTAVELAPLPVDDNLSVPLATAAMLVLLGG